MGKAALPMALIRDDQKRNQAFRNQRKGLIRKCEELSKLCDINVCAISFPLGCKQRRRFKIKTCPNEHRRRVWTQARQEHGQRQEPFHLRLHPSTQDCEAWGRLEQLITIKGVGKDTSAGSSGRSFFSMVERHFYGMSEASLRVMAAQIGEKIVSLEPAIEQMRMVVLPNKTKPFYSQQYMHCKMPINPGGTDVACTGHGSLRWLQQ